MTMDFQSRWTHWASGDEFVEQGTPAQLYSLCGYDAAGILRTIMKSR